MASARNSSKKKIEKKREQAVDSILICQNNVNHLSSYKGDNSLRQSSINYIQLCYKIFNDNYARNANTKDIAKRSYDEMQADVLLQQTTNDTLEVAIKRMKKAERDFAAKYKVTLVDPKTGPGDQMEETDKLIGYRDKVHLLFYKCRWEDGLLTDALNQKNATKIEQTSSALNKYAIEGLEVLDTLKTIGDDASLANACRRALGFYKNETGKQIPLLTGFFLKEANFKKIKAAMYAKSTSQRTSEDVDNYNNAVTDLNNGINTFNKINNDLNSGRSEISKNWEATEKQFVDVHTP
jgi:hypothetical protein